MDTSEETVEQTAVEQAKAVRKIAVIGAGNIGEALIAGLVSAGVDPKAITATNRSPQHSEELAQRYQVAAETDNREAVQEAEAVFLCVKPAQIGEVLEEIGEVVEGNDVATVLVSMAAGVTLSAMDAAVPTAGAPLVRVMPNTPMLVGKGVFAVSWGRYVTEEQRRVVRCLLASAGEVVEVAEAQMDAVTAISGSGPAYYFLLTEALIDAGVSLGLPRELASRLATATADGAGAMLTGSVSPAELRAAVSSPAGTTVRAIRELEESGLRSAVYRATEACAARSAELGL